jgi:hypothetical protein
VTLALPRDPQGNVFGMIAAAENGRVESGDGAAITWFEILGPEPKALRDYDVQRHIGGPGPVEVMTCARRAASRGSSSVHARGRRDRLDRPDRRSRPCRRARRLDPPIPSGQPLDSGALAAVLYRQVR